MNFINEIMSFSNLSFMIGNCFYQLSSDHINVPIKRKGMFDIIVKKLPISAITIEECQKLLKLSHKNVQRILKCLQRNYHHYLVSEVSINLVNHLKKMQKKNPEIRYIDKLQLMKDITEGLAYLHKCQIVHKNLCPENVIVDNKVAKIANFGFVDSNVDGFFVAPNARFGNFSISSDIFSLAMLLLYTFLFKSEEEIKAHIVELIDGRRPFALLYPDNIFNIDSNFRLMCLIKLYNRIISDEIKTRPKSEWITKHIIFWDRFKIFEILAQLKADQELIKKFAFLKMDITYFEDKFYEIFRSQHVLTFMDTFYLEIIELSEKYSNQAVVNEEMSSKEKELHAIFSELGVPRDFIRTDSDIDCDYSTESLCGVGVSKVYKASYKNRTVAVKLIDKTKFNEVQREIRSLCIQSKNGDNEHVVMFHGVYAHDLCYPIILEWAIADLSKFLMEKEGEFEHHWHRISEKKILLDSAKGVLAIHNNNIMHLDLKPENILIVDRNGDGNLRACIGDFGKSKEPSNYLAATATAGMIGTHNWFSPEMKRYAETFNRRKSNPPDITSASDIYQLGLIFGYVLIDRKFHTKKKEPRKGKSKAFNNKIDKVKSEMLVNYRKSHNNDFLTEFLIERMIYIDPTKRLDALGVVRNPFFWTGLETEKYLKDVREHFKGHAANENEKEDVKNKARLRVFVKQSWIALVKKNKIKAEIRQWSKNNPPKLNGSSIFDLIDFILMVRQEENKHIFKETRAITSASDPDVYYKFWTLYFEYLLPFVYYNIELPIKEYYSVKIPNEPVPRRKLSIKVRPMKNKSNFPNDIFSRNYSANNSGDKKPFKWLAYNERRSEDGDTLF